MSSVITETLSTPPKRFSGAKGLVPRILMVALLATAVALTLLILFADLGRETVGVLVIVQVIVLLLVGVHIALAILIPAIIGLLQLGAPSAVFGLLEDLPYTVSGSWQYSVIPFFILMGMALWRAGISTKAFDAAKQWFGQVPGGLGIATVSTGGGLAAASGSTIGISYALGRVALPEMFRAGYNPGLAIGAVSVAGILGQIIPPSVMIVIYAGVAQTPVGLQLMAGVVPGVMLMLAFGGMIFIRAVVNKKAAPTVSMDGVTWGTRFRSLVGAFPLVLVIVTIIGGILSGIFTATEAGAIGALIALVIGAVTLPHVKGKSRGKELWSFIRDVAVSTVYSTAPIFLLIIAVYFLARVVALSQIAQSLATMLSSLGLTPLLFLLLLIPFYLILGAFLDTLGMLLLTVPVLLPTLALMEIDLLWFGIFVIILAEMALITPPLGMLIFIIHRIANTSAPEHKISLSKAFQGVIWYLLATIVVLLLMIAWPDLVTWLPNAGNVS